MVSQSAWDYGAGPKAREGLPASLGEGAHPVRLGKELVRINDVIQGWAFP